MNENLHPGGKDYACALPDLAALLLVITLIGILILSVIILIRLHKFRYETMRSAKGGQNLAVEVARQSHPRLRRSGFEYH